MSPLPRSTPTAHQVDSAGIHSFVAALEQAYDVHSYMLVRHGFVVAEGWWPPGGADVVEELWSLSKSCRIV